MRKKVEILLSSIIPFCLLLCIIMVQHNDAFAQEGTKGKWVAVYDGGYDPVRCVCVSGSHVNCVIDQETTNTSLCAPPPN